MTGVESVSNGVPLFRKPRVPLAQRTLGAIIAILVVFLVGIAFLSHTYGIGATPPGQAGYQSILSILVGAVTGRGAFYYLTMTAIGTVLALSANTSFAGFPRLCRVLAEDGFLPDIFAVRGRRLVFSQGIMTLAVLSGGLLVGFGGLTDRLIPLFAIGALLAFTLSQAGMVQHWRRNRGRGFRRSAFINGLGALATGVTLLVVAVSKFAEGAWLIVVVIPTLAGFFSRVNGHYRRIATQIATIEPLEIPDAQRPIVVVPAGSWNKMTQHGLKFALRLSPDVHVVQVKTETDNVEDLSDNWELLIRSRARAEGIAAPKLVVLTSEYRRFFKPLVDYVLTLEKDNPERDVVVVIPDIILSHWYEGLLHNNRGAFLRSLLRARGGPRVVVVDIPFRINDYRKAPMKSALRVVRTRTCRTRTWALLGPLLSWQIVDRAGLLSRISIDPNICFGKPCVRGHRIWVSLILDLLASGSSVKEVLDDYPGLLEEDVLACLAYGAEMSRERYVDVPLKRTA